MAADEVDEVDEVDDKQRRVTYLMSAGLVGCALAIQGGCSSDGSLIVGEDPVLDAAVEDVDVPTEEEAAEEAAATISAENAQEEYERLAREIDAELEDG